MNKIKIVILALAMLIGVGVVAPVVSHAAPKDSIQNGVNLVSDGGPSTSLNVQIKNVVNVMLFVLGALAVIMIIVGGIRYVISAGDSSKVTAAKNTIVYAVVGLVVAILAFAIVNFVIANIK